MALTLLVIFLNLKKLMIKKAVILCGGKATRFNKGKPGPLKPLLKVNNKSILLRIIDIYLNSGVEKIILLGGYKFKQLKNFIANQKKINSKICLIDTGLNTNTGGRLLKAKKEIGTGYFFFTYGDSLADFKPKKAFYSLKRKKNNFLISIYKKPVPYGTVIIKQGLMINYLEKKTDFFINAGFYIFDEKIFQYIKSSTDSLEKKIIPKILNQKKINFYTYNCKFWHPMDNNSDKMKLSKILKNGK